jgi:hypothetical protein
MRVPSYGCCVGGPDREQAPISGQALLGILSIFGALGFLAYAVTFFHAG